MSDTPSIVLNTPTYPSVVLSNNPPLNLAFYIPPFFPGTSSGGTSFNFSITGSNNLSSINLIGLSGTTLLLSGGNLYIASVGGGTTGNFDPLGTAQNTGQILYGYLIGSSGSKVLPAVFGGNNSSYSNIGTELVLVGSYNTGNFSGLAQIVGSYNTYYFDPLSTANLNSGQTIIGHKNVAMITGQGCSNNVIVGANNTLNIPSGAGGNEGPTTNILYGLDNTLYIQSGTSNQHIIVGYQNQIKINSGNETTSASFGTNNIRLDNSTLGYITIFGASAYYDSGGFSNTDNFIVGLDNDITIIGPFIDNSRNYIFGSNNSLSANYPSLITDSITIGANLTNWINSGILVGIPLSQLQITNNAITLTGNGVNITTQSGSVFLSSTGSTLYVNQSPIILIGQLNSLSGFVTGISGFLQNELNNFNNNLIQTGINLSSGISGLSGLILPSSGIASGNTIFGNSNTGFGVPYYNNVSNYLINDGILTSNGLINPSILPTWNSENFYMVPTVNTMSNADPITNGASLQSVMSSVNALTGANGAVLSANNPVLVILPPAIYDLNSGTLTLNNNFVYLVGLTTSVAIAGAVIQSSVSGDASGVININHANPFIYFSNLVFKNSASPLGNLQHTDNHASVINVNGNIITNTAWKNCQFIGKNMFSTQGTPGSSAGPLFQDCMFPTSATAPTQSFAVQMGGKFINCIGTTVPGAAGANARLSFLGDTGTPTSLGGYFSPGTFLLIKDCVFTPSASLQESISLTLQSSASGNGTQLAAGGGLTSSSYIANSNINVVASSNPVSIDGLFVNCVIQLGNTILNSPTFQDCYILTNAANGFPITIAGFPRFYGCRFGVTGFYPTTSGLIDMQHCQLPSTWVTPINLTYATTTLASGFNVVSTNANFDSP